MLLSMPSQAAFIAPTHHASLWKRTLCTAVSPHVRGQRVAMLLAATFIMGCADLALTLTYVTSMGMVELNPVARFIMQFGSVKLIAIFKFGAMMLNAGILLAFRQLRIAEIATWICFLVMVALSCKWLLYATHISNYAAEMHEGGLSEDARFVMMPQ
jgi:hypothetical protein